MTDIFTCIEIESTLSAYFDEELSLKERAIVENHLKECSKCREELESIKKISYILKNSAQNNESACPELNVSEAVFSKLDICREVSEDLSAFIDRELPKDKIVKICEHLLQCEYCRADYESLKVTQETIKDYFGRSTDKLVIHEKICKETIVNKIISSQKQRKLIYSAAVFLFLSAISYFSIDLFYKNQALHNINLANNDKLKYDQSENYLFSSVYSRPLKEVLLLIYEK